MSNQHPVTCRRGQPLLHSLQTPWSHHDAYNIPALTGCWKHWQSIAKGFSWLGPAVVADCEKPTLYNSALHNPATPWNATQQVVCESWAVIEVASDTGHPLPILPGMFKKHYYSLENIRHEKDLWGPQSKILLTQRKLLLYSLPVSEWVLCEPV